MFGRFSRFPPTRPKMNAAPICGVAVVDDKLREVAARSPFGRRETARVRTRRVHLRDHYRSRCSADDYAGYRLVNRISGN